MTLNLSALPLGTRLRTRDGRSARLLATDLKGEYPCAVAIDYERYEIIERVTAAGNVDLEEQDDLDIVSVEAAPRAMLDVGRK